MASSNTLSEIIAWKLGVWATCLECLRSKRLAIEEIEAVKPGLTVGQLKAGLRCEGCGRRGAAVSIAAVIGPSILR